jgi:methyl-accepting chemotaxis protein
MKPRGLQITSLQVRIGLWGGLCLLLLAASVIGYAVFSARTQALEAATADVQSQAAAAAGVVKAELEIAMDASRTLAQSMEAVKDPTNPISLTRDQASALIREVLIGNPQLTGIGTVWEPNTFDGHDAEYVNKPGHDATGRFIPYWSRGADGQLALSPVVDYETPGVGDFYLGPKQTKQEGFIEPYIYPVQGVDVLMATADVPIVVNDTFYGIMGVDTRLDTLQQRADAFDLYDGTATMALISNGGVLAGVTGRPDLVGKSLVDLNPEYEKDLARIRAGESFSEFSGGNIEVYAPVIIGKSATPWAVSVVVPEEKIYASVNAQMWTLIGIGLGAMLLSMIVLWIAARQIARPIKDITGLAEAITKGDLDHKVDIRQADEVGRLADAFRNLISALSAKVDVANQIAQGDLTVQAPLASDKDVLGQALQSMINNLRRLIGEVAQNALSVNSASAQLAGAAAQAGEATNQITVTMQQIAQGTGQQTQTISRAAGSVEQLARAIDGVAHGAQEQAESVSKAAAVVNQLSVGIQQVAASAQAGAEGSRHATQAANTGVKTVEDTIAGMQAIKQKVGLSTEKVREMGRHSDQIGAIVQTIDDIASQTNLLALNAAIEAARAGEHGKGFAVVADEVRKLAEKSALATKEIAGLIRGIQSTIVEAVQSMDQGAAEVETGVSRANQSGQVLGEILKAVQQVSQQVEGIATAAQAMEAASREMVAANETVSAVVEENTAATEEMAASSGEVTQAIEGIASVSQENSAAAEQVTASAEEMSAQVEEVTASTQSLAEMARALQDVVAQFRLPDQVTDAVGRVSKPAAPVAAPVAAGHNGSGNGHRQPQQVVGRV